MVVDCVIVPALCSSAKWSVQCGRNQIDAGFDKPTSHQAALAPGIASIAITDSRVFQTNIKCPASLRSCHQVPRLGLKRIENVEFVRLVPVMAKLIHSLSQLHSFI